MSIIQTLPDVASMLKNNTTTVTLNSAVTSWLVSGFYTNCTYFVPKYRINNDLLKSI